MDWNLSSPIWLTWQASMLTPWRSHLKQQCQHPNFQLWQVKQPWPWGTKAAPAAGPPQIPVSEPVPFCLGPGERHTPSSVPLPYSWTGPRFLRKIPGCNFFPSKGGNNVELDISNQDGQPGDLNDTLTPFICCLWQHHS